MEYVTVRQLAEELGLSKVAVNNRIDKLDLRSQLIKSGNRHLIPEETAEAIRESFRVNRKTEPPAQDTQSAVIDILSEQLRQKDKQIESLMAQLEMLQSQNTDLLKSVREHSYLLLQANGIQTENNESVADPEEAERTESEERDLREVARETHEKKGFIRRLFNL